MTGPPRVDVLDMVDELCSPHTHREHVSHPHHNSDGSITWVGYDHVTRNPPLIVQLREAVEASGSGPEGGARAGFTSKPAARLEAIDAYIRIDDEAARWVRKLGEDDPGDTAACIRQLAGLAAGLTDPAVARKIERDVRGWWATARIVTGWDSPPWTPDNTCPMCDRRGGLRVRLVLSIATCVECGELWDEFTIGHLADHIRTENQDEARQDA